MPSKERFADCFSAALWYSSQGIGVVPMRPALTGNVSGKPSPIPWIRWQAEGPLRGSRHVREFWSEHPGAQLAILLGRGLAAVDIDLKHLPDGRAPADAPLPCAIPGGYVESTKSGGLHYLFRFRERLDPVRAERVTGLAGYVDVFTGGLLIVAPSRFEGADRPYEVVNGGGLPVFPTLRAGLAASAPWLARAWEEKWARSRATANPAGPRTSQGQGVAPEVPRDAVDPQEVARALGAVRVDPAASSLFSDGARHPNGAVDRSLTEFRIAAFLKERGFSREATWAVVRACPHAKSPRDPRGFVRFERQVWGRLSEATRPAE